MTIGPVGGQGQPVPGFEAPEGQLVYTADGYMSVVITATNRATFGGAGANNLAAAAVDEKIQAWDSSLAYAGRYRASDDGTVTHEIDVSVFPNWDDTEQQRGFRVSGDELTLTTTVNVGGAVLAYEMVWDRMRGREHA
jgi:hypothetical protein